MTTDLFPVAILAGGTASRLRPLTETIPKALIEINGEPFIIHQLRLLRRQMVRRVVLCVGYLGEKIVDFLGKADHAGIQIEYSFDEPGLLGTGGGIKHALPHLGEDFFVLYGDSYLECDYQAIQDAFIRSRQLGLMTVYRNGGKWDRSNVEYSERRIVAYDKVNLTPRMNHIDYGLGVLNRASFSDVPDGQPFDLASVYQELLLKDQLAALEVLERFYEIGTPSGLEGLSLHLAGRDQKKGVLNR